MRPHLVSHSVILRAPAPSRRARGADMSRSSFIAVVAAWSTALAAVFAISVFARLAV